MRYVVTREQVEATPDDRPLTRRQEQLITKLVKDFLDTKNLLEYKDYAQRPTKANASSFITLVLEENQSQVRSLEGCAKYITTRPHAEHLGDHGLFGDENGVELGKAMLELEHYTGNVWMHIISLRRKDAAHLGYNSAQAWCALLRTHRNNIAAAINIKPQGFRWRAAFHSEGEHPYAHMMAWPTNPGQAYLSRDGIRQIKSALTNQIFKQEMLHLYGQKFESRDELVRETREVTLELSRQMSGPTYEYPEAERMILNLAQQLGKVKGKKSYNHLPKRVKRQVNKIVNQTGHLSVVDRYYQKWQEPQCRANDYYSEKERQRPSLFKQKGLRAIKNMVVREAEHVWLNHTPFEGRDVEDYGDWVDERSLAWTCRELQRLVENKALPLEDRDETVERLGLLAKMSGPYAQAFLGQLYRNGGLLIPDIEKTRHWLEQAAERELPQTQYALGKLLLSDGLDMRDSSEGIRWPSAAAQNGNDYTAYVLGKEYLQGDHVLKNVNTTAEYLYQAAEARNPWAQYLLGKLYLIGEGAEQDQEVAYGQFQAMTMQGHTYVQFLEECMEQSPPGSPSLMFSTTQLLRHMGNIFWDSVPEDSASTGLYTDHKRLQVLQEKRITLGYRLDDHVEQTIGGMTMRQR